LHDGERTIQWRPRERNLAIREDRVEEGKVWRATQADAARIDEPWGSLTWVASSAIGNTDRLTVGRVVIKAGAQNPRHCHAGCEEVLTLLTGRLEHSIGDRLVALEPGDTIVIPRGVPHNARALPGVDAEMMVVYDTGKRDFHPA
jgi:quercetin dioxygenase-like cupin family protein